ncbi:hypothetical protein AN189_06900 [Loktanella sp. 3ANDIMAR09]|uniref:hypothetical protein n=1 Tax=Loktanella sp. 3ANDIMAR09 TaxID=1225657 RepID=UPI0006F4BAED|nr:hypothetical protein [Loktanella sp. 3ANDIMAR09]KQI69274.1 hypothetical protein AN189_06900 [Loktanella sp. 3ANDIMAR09]
MNDILPDAIRKGLQEARRVSLDRGERLCVHDGDDVYRILRFWQDGMALDAGACDKLRGRVDIYDGARHLYQALILGADVTDGECHFRFKWLHPVRQTAALDFESELRAPAGLLTRA